MISEDRPIPPCAPESRGYEQSVEAPYDAIAADYADMNVTFKNGVIGPSLHAVLGNLEGMTVIDWACGSGEFSTLPLITICHAEEV
jgi:ubiquinone/menaquinone biosynthesis C-methylase UbiE